MYSDNLNQLFDVAAIQQQQDAAVKAVKDYLKEVTDADNKIKGLTSFKQLPSTIAGVQQAVASGATATQNLSQSILNASVATKKLEGAKKSLAIAESQYGEAIQSTAEKTKELNNELRQQDKFNKSAVGSIKQLKAGLSLARIEYDKLSADIRENTVEGQAQLLNIQRVTNEIKRLEEQMGIHGRSVGHYSKAWNGLHYQTTGLLRELPSLAYGLNTLIAAWGNQLPLLFDEVKNIRLENARLLAAGQKGVPVWKQMAGAIFNWQTAVLGIITVLSVHGEDILNWLTGTENAAEKAAKSIDELTEAIENLQAADEAVSKERDNITKFLVARAKAEGKSAEEIADIEKDQLDRRIRDQKNYIQELNKVYKQQVAARAFGPGSSDEETDEKLRLAVVATQKKIAEEEQRLQTLQTDRRVKDFDLISERRAKDEAERKKAEEEAKKAREKAIRDEQQRSKEIGSSILPTSDGIRREIAALQNEGLASEFNDAIFKIDSFEKENLAQIEQQFKSGEITAAQYERSLTETKRQAEEERLRLELEYSKKILLSGAVEYEETKKLALRIKDIEVELAKEGNDEKLKADKEYAAASLKIEQERHERVKQLRAELTGAIVQFGQFAIDRESENLQDKQKLLEQERNLEIAKIEALTIADEEKAARKAVVEQDMLQRQKANEEQQNQLQRRRFELEQLAALARLYMNTQETVAKIQAQAALLSASPTTIALAPQALSQIPLVYTSAALSAGLIAAQVVAYEDGVIGKQFDGPALVGEGRKGGKWVPELVNPGGGQPFITSGPMLMPNLPKFSDVIPMPELLSAPPGVAMQQMANAAMLAGGGNTARTEALLHAAVEVLREIKDKEVDRTEIKNGSMYKSKQRGHVVDNFLRKNYYS